MEASPYAAAYAGQQANWQQSYINNHGVPMGANVPLQPPPPPAAQPYAFVNGIMAGTSTSNAGGGSTVSDVRDADFVLYIKRGSKPSMEAISRLHPLGKHIIQDFYEIPQERRPKWVKALPAIGFTKSSKRYIGTLCLSELLKYRMKLEGPDPTNRWFQSVEMSSSQPSQPSQPSSQPTQQQSHLVDPTKDDPNVTPAAPAQRKKPVTVQTLKPQLNPNAEPELPPPLTAFDYDKSVEKYRSSTTFATPATPATSATPATPATLAAPLMTTMPPAPTAASAPASASASAPAPLRAPAPAQPSAAAFLTATVDNFKPTVLPPTL